MVIIVGEGLRALPRRQTMHANTIPPPRKLGTSLFGGRHYCVAERLVRENVGEGLAPAVVFIIYILWVLRTWDVEDAVPYR